MTDKTNPKDLMGAKKDPISLVPPEGIRCIAKAMYYGAYEAKRLDGTKGYGPYNWRDNKIQYSIYLDAILRHTLALIDRLDIDPDSHQHHLGHIGANVCILLDAMKYGCLVDNRPKLPEKRPADIIFCAFCNAVLNKDRDHLCHPSVMKK